MSTLRFQVLPNNLLCVRDTQEEVNYHTGSRIESKELAELLNKQEEIIEELKLRLYIARRKGPISQKEADREDGN